MEIVLSSVRVQVLFTMWTIVVDIFTSIAKIWTHPAEDTEKLKGRLRRYLTYYLVSYVAISIAATIWVCIDDSTLVVVLTTTPQFVHFTRVDFGPTLMVLTLTLGLSKIFN